jgi:hypothetical protein
MIAAPHTDGNVFCTSKNFNLTVPSWKIWVSLASTNKNIQMLKESLVEHTQQYQVVLAHSLHIYLHQPSELSHLSSSAITLYAYYISPLVLHATHLSFNHCQVNSTSAHNMCLCPLATLTNLKSMEGVRSLSFCSLEKVFCAVRKGQYR